MQKSGDAYICLQTICIYLFIYNHLFSFIIIKVVGDELC